MRALSRCLCELVSHSSSPNPSPALTTDPAKPHSQTSLDPPKPGARAKPQTLERPERGRAEPGRARPIKSTFLVTKPGLKLFSLLLQRSAANTGALLIRFLQPADIRMICAALFKTQVTGGREGGERDRRGRENSMKNKEKQGLTEDNNSFKYRQARPCDDFY